MAEIKSTLDLVLEKTRNLTLTDEEKRGLQRKEREGKIRGLVQKFLDRLINVETLKAEFNAIAAGREKEARLLLKNILIGQIDPEGDNGSALEILQDVLGEDPLAEAIRAFQKKMADEKPGYLEKLRRELASRQVSGSAVVPNLSRSREWDLFRKSAVTEFRNRFLRNPDS